MDLNKIFIKSASPTKMGGQAVMEGIMMKGSDRTAIAIRKANGEIHVKEEPLKPKSKWMKVPVIRGVVSFVDALVTGTTTLMYSAEVLEESFDESEQAQPDKVSLWFEKHFGQKGAFTIMLYTSVVIAIAFSVGLFVLFPTAAVGWVKHFWDNPIFLNLVEGIFRITLFVIYIALVSRMKDIQRVFEFHGAEHQAIHCFENELDLTPENCMKFEPLHPRCGTSFMMFVMVISLLLFSFLGWPTLLYRIISRIVLIPVVAGLSYELLRWAGQSTSPIVKVLSIPGLALQKLTTRKADAEELEVAIVAINACLSEEPAVKKEYDLETEASRAYRMKKSQLQERESDNSRGAVVAERTI